MRNAMVYVGIGMLAAAIGFGFAVQAEGGKNRLSPRLDAITEGLVLCQQSGVRQILLTDDGAEILVDCTLIEPAF